MTEGERDVSALRGGVLFVLANCMTSQGKGLARMLFKVLRQCPVVFLVFSF